MPIYIFVKYKINILLEDLIDWWTVKIKVVICITNNKRTLNLSRTSKNQLPIYLLPSK